MALKYDTSAGREVEPPLHFGVLFGFFSRFLLIPVRFLSFIMASFSGSSVDVDASSRRNFILSSIRKDSLMEWMKDMLNHSFVLDSKDSYVGTMKYFEALVEEHRAAYKNKDLRSRLKEYVPSVGRFITPLPLSQAFTLYDSKYSISKRRFVSPTFNEIRHILNLSQIMAIGPNLQLITFDGDQTLYTDGGNFEDNEELALGIMSLMCHGVKVAVVTAAGYGLDGSKYSRRLQGLLDRFVLEKLTQEQVENFFVMGGECNYLLQCTLQTVSKDDKVEGGNSNSNDDGDDHDDDGHNDDGTVDDGLCNGDEYDNKRLNLKQ